MNKTCTKCLLTKFTTDFHVRRASKDGLSLICKPCAITHAKAWAFLNREKSIARSNEHYHRTKEQNFPKRQLYHVVNRERLNFGRAKWAIANKERRKQHALRYYKANKPKYLHWARLREAAKQERLPVWADKIAIKEIYLRRPPGMEVDHIIPLRGKDVSGLHVHNNLQYLPISMNRSKGNRILC